MKNDVDSLKWAEKGGGGGSDALGIVVVAILLALAFSFFVASPGGDDEPVRSTPATTATASRQQAARPASQPETAVFLVATVTMPGVTRPASRPSQGDYTPLPTTAVPSQTPLPTYTPYPTNTPVPTVAPSQTPLPTYTTVATYTPLATYTAVPTETRPPVLAILPVSTPPAPSGNNSDTWLIVGMVICAVLVAVLLIGILVSYYSQRPIVVNLPSNPLAPHRRVLPPPTGKPIRAVAPVPPVPSTSATSANAPVAPVLPEGEGGRLSLKAIPDADKFSQAEIDQLCAIFWRLPEGERTRNRICGEMWGFNTKGEPKKGPNRMAAVDYAIRLCQGQERQKRLDEMTVRRGDRTIPLNQRIIRNQPPQPQKRPFPPPVKGVEG